MDSQPFIKLVKLFHCQTFILSTTGLLSLQSSMYTLPTLIKIVTNTSTVIIALMHVDPMTIFMWCRLVGNH